MKSYPKRIYLAGPWKGDARELTVKLANLIAQHDVTVVRDHEKNKDDPLKQSRTWVHRIDSMMRDCAGLVVILPYHDSTPQKTSPYLIPEILAADAQGIPIVLFANDPLKLVPTPQGGELVVSFANAASGPILRYDDIARFKPGQESALDALLSDAGGFALKNNKQLKPAFKYPHEDIHRTAGAVEDFVGNCADRKPYPFVFNVLPFSLKDSAHQLIASAVFRETGLACHISLDAISGQTSTRGNWESMLRDSELVIAELSELRDTCLFEMGCVIGLGKRVFIVSKHGQQAMPFGLDDQTFYQYKSTDDLTTYVRQVCCIAYRREVFNLTPDFKALAKHSGEPPGSPAWLNQKEIVDLQTRLSISIWAIYLALAFGLQIGAKLFVTGVPNPNMLAVCSALVGFIGLTKIRREVWEKKLGKSLGWLPWVGIATVVLQLAVLLSMMAKNTDSPERDGRSNPATNTQTK